MIGALQLKNRMVMAPMVDGYSEGGMPTARSLEYFRVRAAGGIGLVIVGNIHVDPTHRHVMPGFNLYEDCFTEKLRPLVQVIHDGGAKMRSWTWNRHLPGQPDGRWRPVLTG